MRKVTDVDLLAALKRTGALQEGHFKLSSGLHSSRYVQCAKLLEDPSLAKAVGRALADRLRSFEPESVLSPALGGVVIGYATAAALEVPFRFCERRDSVMLLRRGFELEPSERVVVVEDVVTTGGSAREAGQVAGTAGAVVAAYGAVIDRSSGSAAFEAPFVSLLEIEAYAFEPVDCPRCAAGEALAAPGSRFTN